MANCCEAIDSPAFEMQYGPFSGETRPALAEVIVMIERSVAGSGRDSIARATAWVKKNVPRRLTAEQPVESSPR